MEPVSYIKIEKYGRPWHDWFYYDPTSPSGIRWRVDRRRGRGAGYIFITAGTSAGTKTDKGYYVVEVEDGCAMTHRIVWEMHHGPLAPGVIVDHCDGNKDHNWVDNLEAKTHTGNARNHKLRASNQTGVCGVQVRYKNGCKRYVVSWRNLDKSASTKSFAVNKYGEELAFQLAVAYRTEKILQLNQQGAGYTGRHGTKETHEEIAHSAAS